MHISVPLMDGSISCLHGFVPLGNCKAERPSTSTTTEIMRQESFYSLPARLDPLGVGIASALGCSWGGAVAEDSLEQSSKGVSGYIYFSPFSPPNESHSHTLFASHSLTWSPFLLLVLTTLYICSMASESFSNSYMVGGYRFKWAGASEHFTSDPFVWMIIPDVLHLYG